MAHRGGIGPVPENTLAAFDNAIALGADAIEGDIRRTRDRICVIHHDPHITTASGSKGQAIASLTYAELHRQSPHIPTLAAILQHLQGRIRLNLELKEAGYPEQILSLLTQHNCHSDTLVTSFLPDAIAPLATTAPPDLSLGLLFEPNRSVDIDKAIAIGASAIAPHHTSLTPDLLDEARRHNFSVWTWTVNHLEDFRRSLALSPDAIVTDRVDLARAIVSEC